MFFMLISCNLSPNSLYLTIRDVAVLIETCIGDSGLAVISKLVVDLKLYVYGFPVKLLIYPLNSTFFTLVSLIYR